MWSPSGLAKRPLREAVKMRETFWCRVRATYQASAVLLCLCTSAWAQSEPFSLSTPAGLVSIKSTAGPVCGSDSYEFQCSVLSVGERRIAVDHYVTVGAVLPDRSHPDIVVVFTETGGSACCSESYMIDVSRSRAAVFKGFSPTDKARVAGGDVVFDMVDGEDKVGDTLASTFRYRLGSSRKPVKIASGVRRGEPILGGQPTAYDVLNNPALRRPLLKLVGTEGFAQFRQHFGVSGPTELVRNQYLVGTGIIPHDGPNGGVFVIDTRNDLAWAVVVDNAGPNADARRWGVLTPQDSIPRNQIEKWQQEADVQPWRVKDVPLGEGLLDAYFAPRAKKELPKPAPIAAALATATSRSSAGAVDAPLEKSGGTFTVPVTINDAIKLNFVVDSGAADVSIPADVVMTLTRTGTIQPSDFLGEQTYRLADGSTVPSRTFRIRSLKVGDKIIEDVTGSVASVNGSLLLGQSFLNRFKSWSIDNEKHALVLK